MSRTKEIRHPNKRKSGSLTREFNKLKLTKPGKNYVTDDVIDAKRRHRFKEQAKEIIEEELLNSD